MKGNMAVRSTMRSRCISRSLLRGAITWHWQRNISNSRHKCWRFTPKCSKWTVLIHWLHFIKKGLMDGLPASFTSPGNPKILQCVVGSDSLILRTLECEETSWRGRKRDYEHVVRSVTRQFQSRDNFPRNRSQQLRCPHILFLVLLCWPVWSPWFMI